jgi:hypothetical protein
LPSSPRSGACRPVPHIARRDPVAARDGDDRDDRHPRRRLVIRDAQHVREIATIVAGDLPPHDAHVAVSAQLVLLLRREPAPPRLREGREGVFELVVPKV